MIDKVLLLSYYVIYKKLMSSPFLLLKGQVYSFFSNFTKFNIEYLMHWLHRNRRKEIVKQNSVF